MRCPKCHYISFEEADRCRNCGYDLSLASELPAPASELPLNDRDGNPLPPVDLSLSQVEGLHEVRPIEKPDRFDIDPGGSPPPLDLPLFNGHSGARSTTGASAHSAAESSPAVQSAAARIAAGRRMEAAAAEDAPLVRPSAVPRPPIAVRRSTPDAQRLRARFARAEAPRLELDAPDEALVEADAEPTEASEPVAATRPAPPGRRVLAGLLDALIVGGIDVGVLYFTLKLCDLPLSATGVLQLPAVPLVAFLLMLDGGYAVTFTAVMGQTIGKMATGLRVVQVTRAGEDDGQPPFGFAILRTAAYAASLLPVGLGFLPALFATDRRALHDRLADTRVVQL